MLISKFVNFLIEFITKRRRKELDNCKCTIDSKNAERRPSLCQEENIKKYENMKHRVNVHYRLKIGTCCFLEIQHFGEKLGSDGRSATK